MQGEREKMDRWKEAIYFLLEFLFLAKSDDMDVHYFGHITYLQVNRTFLGNMFGICIPHLYNLFNIVIIVIYNTVYWD